MPAISSIIGVNYWCGPLFPGGVATRNRFLATKFMGKFSPAFGPSGMAVIPAEHRPQAVQRQRLPQLLVWPVVSPVVSPNARQLKPEHLMDRAARPENSSSDAKAQLWLLLVLAGVCLLLALVKFHVYWPYQLSRWGLCAGGIWLASRANGWRCVVLGALAVIYNPLLPFHFGDAWPSVNGISAAGWLAVHPVAAKIAQRAQ